MSENYDLRPIVADAAKEVKDTSEKGFAEAERATRLTLTAVESALMGVEVVVLVGGDLVNQLMLRSGNKVRVAGRHLHIQLDLQAPELLLSADQTEPHRPG